jgi:hypothetical protein
MEAYNCKARVLGTYGNINASFGTPTQLFLVAHALQLCAVQALETPVCASNRSIDGPCSDVSFCSSPPVTINVNGVVGKPMAPSTPDFICYTVCCFVYDALDKCSQYCASYDGVHNPPVGAVGSESGTYTCMQAILTFLSIQHAVQSFEPCPGDPRPVSCCCKVLLQRQERHQVHCSPYMKPEHCSRLF